MEKNEKLQSLRHTLAHLLVAAMRELYPGAKNAIGPAIDDGFYQDFDLPKSVSVEDFPKIEKKMREILKTWNTFDGREVTLEEAKKEKKKKLKKKNNKPRPGGPNFSGEKMKKIKCSRVFMVWLLKKKKS